MCGKFCNLYQLQYVIESVLPPIRLAPWYAFCSFFLHYGMVFQTREYTHTHTHIEIRFMPGGSKKHTKKQAKNEYCRTQERKSRNVQLNLRNIWKGFNLNIKLHITHCTVHILEQKSRMNSFFIHYNAMRRNMNNNWRLNGIQVFNFLEQTTQ